MFNAMIRGCDLPENTPGCNGEVWQGWNEQHMVQGARGSRRWGRSGDRIDIIELQWFSLIIILARVQNIHFGCGSRKRRQ